LALQCGYRDLASFRHHFEEQFQVAPEALQQRWNFSSE
jgi:transcriptional regulator GlxA family with amidase domain